jgi:hypothetical protein
MGPVIPSGLLRKIVPSGRSSGLPRIETAHCPDPAVETFVSAHHIADFDHLGLIDGNGEHLLAPHQCPAVAGRRRGLDVKFVVNWCFDLYS